MGWALNWLLESEISSLLAFEKHVSTHFKSRERLGKTQMKFKSCNTNIFSICYQVASLQYYLWNITFSSSVTLLHLCINRDASPCIITGLPMPILPIQIVILKIKSLFFHQITGMVSTVRKICALNFYLRFKL